MSEHISSKPNIIFASANVGDPRYRDLWLVRPEQVGKFAQDTGFDGVEWHPAFPLLAGPKRIARAVGVGALDLYSLHASFRETASSQNPNEPTETTAKKSVADQALASPLGRLVMPEVVASSRFMARVKTATGREDLTSVMYPQRDKDRNKEMLKQAGPKGLKLVQPTDHLAHMIGVRTAEEFTEKMHGLGFDGWVLDTAHMLPGRYGGRYDPVISDLDISLPFLQKRTYGTHLVLGRTDLAPPNSNFYRISRTALKLALDGEYVGQTREIMNAAHDSPLFQYDVLEATASSVHDVTGHTGADLQQDYANLAQTMRTNS